MDGVNIGNLVDLKEHGLQTATRALRDGAGRVSNFCAIVNFTMFIIIFCCNIHVILLKQHLKMKKLWCVVCFMMLEKSLLPVVMVKLVSIDLLFIHHYIDSDKDI